MAKLTKYTNFKALKAEGKLQKATQVETPALPLEFEDFLKQLQKAYAIKKKTKTSYGK